MVRNEARRRTQSLLIVSEIAISLVLLVIGIAAVAWAAGKIYRVGLLSTGKKPTLGELLKWVRAA